MINIQSSCSSQTPSLTWVHARRPGPDGLPTQRVSPGPPRVVTPRLRSPTAHSRSQPHHPSREPTVCGRLLRCQLRCAIRSRPSAPTNHGAVATACSFRLPLHDASLIPILLPHKSVACG
eukprot:3114024-Prymnesium_polylepis.1